ncbi:MAG: hypothetical protein Ct9H300mP19_20410 [Dehalococcoidia bacterium]|nr:MAG: hypothetical protein Ct9H300mP19_20410 [Dehalococcoidia bacterium]
MGLMTLQRKSSQEKAQGRADHPWIGNPQMTKHGECTESSLGVIHGDDRESLTPKRFQRIGGST